MFAVVKMASSETSLVSERSQVYILKQQGFKVSKIMEIFIKSKYWFARCKTYVILQILGVFVCCFFSIFFFFFFFFFFLLKGTSSFFKGLQSQGLF